MRASLIVVVWNGKSYLSKCLHTLQQELTSADELIVVDNASVDGSPEYIAANFPEIKLVRSAQNLGYAGGVNCGLETAQGEYFFIFNQDLELHSGWLSNMMRALAESNVGVVGCKILYPDGLLQHAGGIIRWPQALPDHYGHRQVDDDQWDQSRDVDYVTGAAWGFSRTLIDNIGVLDESFWPGYFEEVDFCFRAADAGFCVRYVPDAVVMHAESTTLKQGSDQYIRAFHKNRLRFVFKRLSPKQFAEAFVPAEQVWIDQVITPRERNLMGSVYKLSMLTAAEVYAARPHATIVWTDVQYVLQGLTALWQRTRALLS